MNIANVLRDFNKDDFWENITAKKLECKQKYTTEEVHHPKLKFMLKWLAFTFFPREKLNTIRQDELHLLYIIIKKRKTSPIKLMLSYWKTVPPTRKCSISFTSWITRLAMSLDLLSKATLIFIFDAGRVIEYDFFFHAHMLKRRDNKVIMIYKKYRNEYELSNEELRVYSVDSFTFLESSNIGRCLSARISRVPRTVYTGTDPTPPGERSLFGFGN